jgi:hypothetical protein
MVNLLSMRSFSVQTRQPAETHHTSMTDTVLSPILLTNLRH